MTVAETVLLVLIGAGLYVVSLWLFPFRPCARCGGSGRRRGSNRKRYGECRRCKGTGRKRRLGAKTIHRGAISLADKARARKAGKR
jgi:hypothetical protein